MGQDPDAALALIAEMVTATDERLRAAARRLAARLVLDRVRSGRPRSGGVGRMRQMPADRGGDLDIDASTDALLDARAFGRPPALGDLTAREWGRPELALCLLLDRSGSMSGERLATAALAAAACALRAPTQHAVIAFARDVQVLRSLDVPMPPETVVDEVLALRGHGTTDLVKALRAAGEQLQRSRASRQVTVLLSDCRDTGGADAAAAARAVGELIVLAPADDVEQAQDLAERVGARWAPLVSATEAPAVLADLLA